MTDKEIIIDGVDVSECETLTYKDSVKPMCGNTGICCRGRKNCYYKQLKRKEQECEESKDEIKHYKQIAQYHGNLSVKYTNKSAKYKQTLTEIKEIAENMNNECFYNDFSCDGCDMINGCTYQGKTRTLQKIREVKE